MSVPAFAQDICDLPPGGDNQILRGAIRNPLTMSGDPFLCGIISAPTPATCTLFNRVYTEQESSCVNREQGVPPPDYLPFAYGPDLRQYEGDRVVIANWPLPLGSVSPVPKNWFLIWETIQDANTPAYIGYYVVQSDVVALGEIGNPRSVPCSQGTNLGSCMELGKGSTATLCNPVNTPLGTIDNLGALAPVPVPILLSVLADSDLGFADPSGRIALEWVPACAQTQGIDSFGFAGTAPEPIMGYRLEVFVDRNANSLIDTATAAGWDPLNRAVNGGCESGSFVPLLDIAPLGGNIAGNRLTKSMIVPIADFTATGGVFENPAQIEALTFRLRILFRDDRFTSPPGGKDFVIDPVCSAPSAMGAPIANPQIFGSAAGAVPDGNLFPGTPLQILPAAGGNLSLSWGGSCNPGDSDFAVYEGILGNFQSHTQKLCTTGGAISTTIAPDPGNRYFLVVPRNSQVEGSYGVKSDLSERLPGISTCVAQQNFACSGTVLLPAVITDPATSISFDFATLNATVTPNGFDTDVFFEWGLTAALGNMTAAEFLGNGSTPAQVSSGLAGLVQNTTYQYRIVASSPVGTSVGSIISFLTLDPIPPTVTTNLPVSLTPNSSTLAGTVNPNGFDTSTRFEWGTTTALGNITTVQNIGNGISDIVVLDDITGLDPQTTHFYRSVATNPGGTIFGATLSFFTPPLPEELVADGSFTEGNVSQDWITEGDFHILIGVPDEYRTAPGWATGGVSTLSVGLNNASGRLFQDISVPFGALSAQFEFWFNITSQEIGTSPVDFLQVSFRDPVTNSLLAVVALLDNTDKENVGSYTQFTFNANSFIGRAVRIEFSVTTDASAPTKFRIDDVSLKTD